MDYNPYAIWYLYLGRKLHEIPSTFPLGFYWRKKWLDLILSRNGWLYSEIRMFLKELRYNIYILLFRWPLLWRNARRTLPQSLWSLSSATSLPKERTITLGSCSVIPMYIYSHAGAYHQATIPAADQSFRLRQLPGIHPEEVWCGAVELKTDPDPQKIVHFKRNQRNPGTHFFSIRP